MFKRIAQAFSAHDLTARYAVDEVLLASQVRFNVTLGQRLAAVVPDEIGARQLTALRWGLIPFWATADDVRDGHRLFHARAETVGEKRAFRSSLAQNRCVLPISGYYETVEQEGQRYTLFIHPKRGETWSVAGLWDEWIQPSGAPHRSCAMITTQTNRLLSEQWKRMPAILRGEDEAKWLDLSVTNARSLRKLLQPLSARDIAIDVVPEVRWNAQDDATLVQRREDSAEVLRGLGLAPQKKLPLPKRNVHRDWRSPDGQVFFVTKSFTRDDYTKWHPVVDVEEGEVFCDCPDFHFRHAAHKPTVQTPAHWCKHLQRAVENCVRHGDLRVK
jgi:putative SOS response-associated peptidase YedK